MTTTTDLGTFTLASGSGYSTFEYVYLKDTNGNNANVVLNGKATLRVTSFPGGNLLPNFFMLVAAQPDLPILSGMYPTGTHPFEPTNALSFTVTASGTTFPANGIKLNLDGVDVSPNLVITGSASTKNVVYPGLQLNAIHTAIITVTNALGHGISVTNQFDTFTQNNFMVEAEDFDYGGGQYISPVIGSRMRMKAFRTQSPTLTLSIPRLRVSCFPIAMGFPKASCKITGRTACRIFVSYGAMISIGLFWDRGLGQLFRYLSNGHLQCLYSDRRPQWHSILDVFGPSCQWRRDDQPGDTTARPVQRDRDQPANLLLGAVDGCRPGCAGPGEIGRRQHPANHNPHRRSAIRITSCWFRQAASPCQRRSRAATSTFLCRPRRAPSTGSSTGLI